MILNSLVKYYEALEKRGETTRPGWLPVRISYAVILRPDGSVKGFHYLKKEVEKGKKKSFQPILLTVPEKVVKASGIKSNFMWENAEYLLGYGADPKTPARAAAARELHEQVLSGCSSPAATAVKNFFASWTRDKLADFELSKEQTDDFSGGASLIFCDEDFHYLHSDPEIVGAWDSHYAGSAGAEKRTCLVTGKKEEIAVLHNKIVGIDGAQAVGATLVAFNAPAFESYGNKDAQGLNAPVGRYAMYAYTTALNQLIKSKNRTKIGDTTVVWYSADASDEASRLFGDAFFGGGGESETLDKIMRSIGAGLPLEFDNVNPRSEFYVLGLSPNAARLSVRFFYRKEFGQFVENLAHHYERLEIVKPAYDRKYLTPFFMGLETVMPEAKDKIASPLLAGALLSAILNDWPYPELLYESVMTRIRAEQKVTSGKAAIIKAYLLKKPNNETYKGVLVMALNKESNNPAYVLGRLFSVLEQVQEAAENSGIMRYFASASSTPALVFPSMLTMSMNHIEKAKKNKNIYISGKNYSKMISQLLYKLDGAPFPARLKNDEQGLFILGYYHEKQYQYENGKPENGNHDTKNESEEAAQ